MKKLRITFSIIFLFMVFLLSFKIYRDFNISKDLKNEEKNRLKKSAKVLNKCFDLENKSKRTLNDSMKLIEHCLEKYGSGK